MLDELERALGSAFPLVVIDRAMIDEPTARWEAYDDADELAAFEGKTWRELPAALLKRHATLCNYAGDALFCALLPAFFQYLLRETESFNDLPWQLAGQLTRRTDVDNQRLDRRLARMTSDQQDTIRKLLSYLSAVRPMEQPMAQAWSTWDSEK